MAIADQKWSSSDQVVRDEDLVEVPIVDLMAIDGVLIEVPIEDRIGMKIVKSTPKEEPSKRINKPRSIGLTDTRRRMAAAFMKKYS